MLRTANPKDFKNATFDALRFFFFCLMQLDERMLLMFTGLVKNALSFYVRSIPFSMNISCSRYHYRYRTCNLTVISSSQKSSNHPVDDAYR